MRSLRLVSLAEAFENRLKLCDRDRDWRTVQEVLQRLAHIATVELAQQFILREIDILFSYSRRSLEDSPPEMDER